MRAWLKRWASRLPAPLRRALVTPAFRAHERLRARGAEDEPAGVGSDGLPVPPSSYRGLVSASGDPEVWLRSGATDARLLRESLERNGARIEEMAAILDFGCGCGRVARAWADLDGPRIFGCDYKTELAAWADRHLGFVEVSVNTADPPAPFPAARFDFIYAVSILTHLPPPAQESWLADFARMLKPGGLVNFTVMGRRFLEELEPGELREFERGRPVVRFPEARGGNLCSAYHPAADVRGRLLPAAGLELVEWVDEDRSGQAASISAVPLQDNWLARKP